MYKGTKLYPILCLLSTSHGHVQENFLEPRNKVPRNDEDGQHFNSELVLTQSNCLVTCQKISLLHKKTLLCQYPKKS